MMQRLKPLPLAICLGLFMFPLLSFAHDSFPHLGKGQTVDKGKHRDNQTTDFMGGIAVSGKPFAQEATLLLSESVDIQGSINVDPAHVGQTAELFVYAGYKSQATDPEIFFTLGKTPEGNLTIPLWDRKPENLAVFDTVTLQAHQEVPMYQSTFIAPGRLAVHFGYRLHNTDGTLTTVWNEYPIAITINTTGRGSSEGETPTEGQPSTEPDNITVPSVSPQFIASYDFRPNPHGYSFENYGNDEQSVTDLTAEDMIQLFGQNKVCRSPEGACILTAAAQQWMEEQVKGMNGGHCEGMAVTSLKLRQGSDFKGKKLAPDFQPGANNTYDLQKSAVRNFIAYYFVTQALQPLASQSRESQQRKPSEILQMLMDSMNAGISNPYTLGFYQPGYKGGHAVTPYGIEKKSEDEFWVYLYDNNYPNNTRRALKINKAAETWVYEGAATNPNEPPSDYRGDANTKTLDLTPQSSREGPFECPFCNSNDGPRAGNVKNVEFSLVGEGRMLIQLADGKRVGYDFDNNQDVNDIEGAIPIHGKYGLGKDIPPVYEVPLPTDNTPFTVYISGKTLSGETQADLMMTGPGYVVGFEEISLDPGEVLVIQIRPDGHQVSFTASQDGETPAMFLAEEPDNDTDPSYLFEVGSDELEADKTLTFTLEGHALNISDNDGNSDNYDLKITRIDDQGSDYFKQDDVTLKPGAHGRVDFSSWSGETGGVNFQEDDEGDGFENEDVIPLQDEDPR